MTMIHFIRPYWLFALIPILFYLIWVIYVRKQHNPWKKICDPHLLPALLHHNYSSNIFSNIILFLFFIIIIFSLAGPSWNKNKFTIYRNMNDLMIILDLSPNMLNIDLSPNRLVRAKFKIRDLIINAQNTQMGLVVFTKEAFVAAPLSQDANTLNFLLEELHPKMMPINGENMEQGLKQGLMLLKQGFSHHGNLLLITASIPNADSLTLAQQISKEGYHLSVLAMLKNNIHQQFAIKQLQQLAKMGNGFYYSFTPDNSDILNIIKNNHQFQTIQDDKIEKTDYWQDQGPWFCLLLIPFFLVILREKLYE